ncbi:MAG: restriction endonuclease [Roseiarcus sp.]
MIPDFQTLMLPVLRSSATGEAKIGDVVDSLASEFGLSDEERSTLLPSGRQTTIANRVHWAKSYLGKAGLVEATGRGRFRITEAGKKVLASPPKRIDIKFLEKFPQFKDFRQATRTDDNSVGEHDAVATATKLTPDDSMRAAQQQLESELGRDLLDRILAAPPAFFERLVIKLLTAMGYGGSTANAARALGKTGDGGVDGVIDQDPLGLDRIYVQAKRYNENAIGPGMIRDFFGALDTFKASKGLFMTTSSFSNTARETAKGLSKRIVLIDGSELTRLMIQYGVGCRVEETLFIKKVDEEFFED